MPFHPHSTKKPLVEKAPIAPGTAPHVGQESGTDLPLPHERDQDAHATSPHPDPVIRQAYDDLAEGQVDTDMRATPGLDAEQRQRLVPGAGGRSKRARP